MIPVLVFLILVVVPFVIFLLRKIVRLTKELEKIRVESNIYNLSLKAFDVETEKDLDTIEKNLDAIGIERNIFSHVLTIRKLEELGYVSSKEIPSNEPMPPTSFCEPKYIKYFRLTPLGIGLRKSIYGV